MEVTLNAKDSGLVGLSIIGILIALVGGWMVFSWFSSGSFLMMIVGGLIALVAGITVAVIGFNAD